MKYKILFLILFSCLSIISFAQYKNDGLILSIKESSVNKKILVFTIENKGTKAIHTDQFRRSKINYVHITGPNGEKITYGGISCHTLGHVKILPNEKRSWEINMKILDDPFISRNGPLPDGKYKLIWVVNKLKLTPFFYEKKKD